MYCICQFHIIFTIFSFSFFQGNGEKTPEKSGAKKESSESPNTNSKEAHPECGAAPNVQEASKEVSASRYDAIASLDETEYNEEERWRDRTSIITKFDHEKYRSDAEDILKELADQIVTESDAK